MTRIDPAAALRRERAGAWQGRGGGPLVIGHRGAAGHAPENTLAGVAAAAALGADAVECDVRLSSDGVPVVIHDDDLRRTTDAATVFPRRASYSVGDFTLRQLRKLDAGAWFGEGASAARADGLGAQPPSHRSGRRRRPIHPSPAKGRGVVPTPCGSTGVCTLDQWLRCCRAAGLGAMVEIKPAPGRERDLAAAVVRVVREAAAGGDVDVMITSFDHVLLVEVRRIAPRIATGLLTGDRLFDPIPYLRRVGADAFLPGAAAEFDSLGVESGKLDIGLIRAVRRAGLAVIPWTVNDPVGMRRLFDAGVSGIITDHPDPARGPRR